MVNWKFKSCPRCNGDLFLDQEIDGWYEHCILCGYVRDVPRAEVVEMRSRSKAVK